MIALAAMSASECASTFIHAFTAMCKHVHPATSDACLNARRVSYLTLYSAPSKYCVLRRMNGKKKKAPKPVKEGESEGEKN